MCRRRLPADALAVPPTPRARSVFSNPSQIVPRHRILNRSRTIPGVICLVFLSLALPFTFRVGANAQTGRASTSAARPRVIELRIGDEIEPIMAEYVDGVISDADR